MVLVSDIINKLRSRLGDTDHTKYRWDDTELCDYINSALSQVALELLLFTDRIYIELKESENRYKLPDNILKVISLNINDAPVVIKSMEWMENNKNNIDNDNFYVCIDEQSFFIYPIELISSGEKIEIVFKYIPQIDDIEDEIDASILVSDALLFYAIHLAYQINTSDKNDLKSKNFLLLFNKQLETLKSTFYSNKHSKRIRSKYIKV
jgi:hypothetical protein